MNAITSRPASASVEPIALFGHRRERVAEHRGLALPAPLLAEWQALAADAAEPNCFAEAWFQIPSLRHLVDGGEVRLLEVSSGEGCDSRLIGILPLTIMRSYARLPLKTVQNWKHHHNFLGTPLIRAGREREFWTAVLEHLDASGWAPNFLHLKGLVEGGPVHRALESAAASLGRGCPVVHRSVRAQLASDLSPEDYFEQNVRKKKRKELKRLQNRLAELGAVSFRRLDSADDLPSWCDSFLALERSGWKGEEGTALACDSATEAFLRETVAGAHSAGKLDFLRLDLDGRPIAMLVNFLAPPGSFSFKIAFDQFYGRYSPGVLIQLENLQVLARGDIGWMDSCAAENHPMIDSLWGERRTIVRLSIPLRGIGRGAAYRTCRALETLSTRRRALAQGLTRWRRPE